MNTQGNDIRLTDELERQLMMQAIEEQFRFKPLAALKGLVAKLAAFLPSAKAGDGQAAQTAS